MRHPVSAPDCLKKRLSSAMRCRIAGLAIFPSAPQAAGGPVRGVAIDEGRRDRRVQFGEDLGGAGPERCRVGRPGGSLTDGRWWLRILLLHPAAGLGLPAPGGSHLGGHGSLHKTSAQRVRRVKDFAGQHLRARHHANVLQQLEGGPVSSRAAPKANSGALRREGTAMKVACALRSGYRSARP